MSAEDARHGLHVYRTAESLARRVAEFARAGLERGEPAVLVPRRENREPLMAELRRLGLDPEALAAEGRLIVCDADANAERCLAAVPSSVDALWKEFAACLAALRARGFARFTVWGETPDVLLKAGAPALSLDLESRWADETAAQGVTLLCSLRGDLRESKLYTAELADACAHHTHVEALEDEAAVVAADARLNEALGTPLARLVSALAEESAASLAAMPAPLARMLWVADHMPATARKILAAEKTKAKA